MSTQQPPPVWDNEIDLRRWLDALIRYKWLILGIFAAAVIISGIANYVVLSPTYQASGGASLPSANGEGGLGMTLLGYQEFASSTPVMDAVGQKLGLELDAGQLRNHYTFEVDQNQRFITVTATAETAEQAFRLASAWIEVYEEQVQAEIQSQYTQLKDSASQQVGILGSQLTEAEESLARFDLENPLSIMESRLASLESELIADETRLRELVRSSIPAGEAKLVSLQDTLEEGNGVIGAGGSPASASPPISSSSGTGPSEVTIPDPTYLEMGQNLIQTRLSALEKELVSSESQLRELTFSTIPTKEEKLASLRAALLREPETLDEPGDSSGQRASGTVLNPVYLQLRQELVDTQVSLATKKKEAESLKNKVASLPRAIDNLRQELVTSQERAQSLKDKVAASQKAEQIRVSLATSYQEAESLETSIASLKDEIRQLRGQILKSRAARQELESQAARRQAAYEPVRAELDRLLRLGLQLTTTASLSTIREPAQPTAPVSPQKTRNMALSGVLGAMLGVAIALFLEYYRGSPSATFPPPSNLPRGENQSSPTRSTR